jgi:hypothetical protein
MDPLTVSLEASAVGAESRNEAWKGDVLALFQHLLSAEFLLGALHKAGASENNRVYTSAVVMWLMIWQRRAERDADVRGVGVARGTAGELLAGTL